MIRKSRLSTAIIIMAGFSGALALKAQNLGVVIYCSTEPSPPPCIEVTNATFVEDPFGEHYCAPDARTACTKRGSIQFLPR